MRLQPPKEMEDYVKPTEFCDCDCEEITRKAEELTKNASSPKEAAVAVFNYVRDQIPLAMGKIAEKASDTMHEGQGHCVTKTNLQIALLRALGIPARYHQVKLHKDILKGIISDSFYKRMGEKIWFHPWCECNISGKWIACDAVFDREIYDAAIKNGIFSKEKVPTIDWDGEKDVEVASAWIAEDVGTHASYDDVSKKAEAEFKVPDFLMKIAINKSNKHTQKLRKQ